MPRFKPSTVFPHPRKANHRRHEQVSKALGREVNPQSIAIEPEDGVPWPKKQVHSKTKGKRRPGKKIAAVQSMGELANALPDLNVPTERSRPKTKSISRSLKSTPGIQKRREQVADLERARFAQNLAIMYRGIPVMGHSITGHRKVEGEREEQDSRAQRFAALRSHITENLNR